MRSKGQTNFKLKTEHKKSRDFFNELFFSTGTFLNASVLSGISTIKFLLMYMETDSAFFIMLLPRNVSFNHPVTCKQSMSKKKSVERMKVCICHITVGL